MSQKEKEVTFKFESKAQAEAFITFYNHHEIIGYNKK